jgi:hypothetical protein
MRRAGVDPWLATVGAGLLALFGAGNENIVWAFQIGFTGALALGLTQLLLADHEGPLGWHDGLGLLAGAGALICSGVGVPMVGVVGLAMLLHRRWWSAVFHTVPLGVLFTAWWLAYGRAGYQTPEPTTREVLEFVASGLSVGWNAMGQQVGGGILLVVMLVSGLLLAWSHKPDGCRLAVPVALLAGSVVFLTVTALGRAWGAGGDAARASRYMYLIAALSLPAVALAATILAARWRVLAPICAAVLLIGVPGNLRDADQRDVRFLGTRSFRQIEGTPRFTSCRVLHRPYVRELTAGEKVRFDRYWLGVSDGRRAGVYDPQYGRTLEVVKGPLTVTFRSVFGLVRVCLA